MCWSKKTFVAQDSLDCGRPQALIYGMNWWTGFLKIQTLEWWYPNQHYTILYIHFKDPCEDRHCPKLFFWWLASLNIPYICWLAVSTPLKNMKVSWEYDIPNMEFQKNNVPNHQPVDLDISPGTNMQSYTVPMANKSCDSSYLYGKAVADCWHCPWKTDRHLNFRSFGVSMFLGRGSLQASGHFSRLQHMVTIQVWSKPKVCLKLGLDLSYINGNSRILKWRYCTI